MYFINGKETSSLEVFLARLEKIKGNIWDRDNVFGKVFTQMLAICTSASLIDGFRNVTLTVEYSLGLGEGVVSLCFDKLGREWEVCVEGPLTTICVGDEWRCKGDALSHLTTSSTALVNVLKVVLKNLIKTRS